jgi:hypothetical protein
MQQQIADLTSRLNALENPPLADGSPRFNSGPWKTIKECSCWPQSTLRKWRNNKKIGSQKIGKGRWLLDSRTIPRRPQ